MNDNEIILKELNPILIKNLENNKLLYKLAYYGLSKLLSVSHNASTNAGINDYIASIKNNNLYIDL